MCMAVVKYINTYIHRHIGSFKCAPHLCAHITNFKISLLNHFWSPRSHSKTFSSVFLSFPFNKFPCGFTIHCNKRSLLWHHFAPNGFNLPHSNTHLENLLRFPRHYISWYKCQHRFRGCGVFCQCKIPFFVSVFEKVGQRWSHFKYLYVLMKVFSLIT